MKIGICGIGGRMGTAVYKNALSRGHVLAAAFEDKSSPHIEKDVSTIMHGSPDGVFIAPLSEKAVGICDVVIDFSSPEAAINLIGIASITGKPLVIGTTGFSDKQIDMVRESSKKTAVLLSPNMSVAVNLLFKLTEIAAKSLNKGFDVEIVEAHHRLKKDSPSGTAKRLLEAVRTGPAYAGAKEVNGREGMTGERSNSEIGVFALRGGDLVGEHTVSFIGMGERIDLSHRATSRDVLASGAITAAEFIKDKKTGYYSMFDVLGL
jgi:4-hydroxy-tetrahydrodipicolinate reductase